MAVAPRFDYEEGLNSIQLILNKEDDERNGDMTTYKIFNLSVMKKNTEGVVCGICHSDNVYVETKQLRSGDEGATNLYTCLRCGSKWKVNN